MLLYLKKKNTPWEKCGYFFFLQCFLIRISLNATIHESPFIKLFIIAAKLTKTKRS
jgi:hypothetical protein